MLKINNKDQLDVIFRMRSTIEKEIEICWKQLNQQILENHIDKKTIIFVDSAVFNLNNKYFLELEKRHNNLHTFPTNISEESKDITSLISCLEMIENVGLSRRDDALYVVGGGALMDLISMAASIYRRGVRVIKVPTTLLGFVDASIGIKSGINFLGQRNRAGTYNLNFDVILDPFFLKSLSTAQLKEGLGEIFKIAIIKSKKLFNLLEVSIDKIFDPLFYSSIQGKKIINESIKLMLEELHDNPTEENLKRCVDFGHTFSPLAEMKSIELYSSNFVPHGFAVGADCIITSIIARNKGLSSKEDVEKIKSLGSKIGFMFDHPIYKRNDILWSSMLEMKKHRADNLNLPYPKTIGSYDFIQELTFDELEQAMREFRDIV